MLRINKRAVKHWMDERRIESYAELARRSGLHPTTLGPVLGGKSFTSATADSIARALDVNTLDILEVVGEVPAPLVAAPAC